MPWSCLSLRLSHGGKTVNPHLCLYKVHLQLQDPRLLLCGRSGYYCSLSITTNNYLLCITYLTSYNQDTSLIDKRNIGNYSAVVVQNLTRWFFCCMSGLFWCVLLMRCTCAHVELINMLFWPHAINGCNKWAHLDHLKQTDIYLSDHVSVNEFIHTMCLKCWNICSTNSGEKEIQDWIGEKQ